MSFSKDYRGHGIHEGRDVIRSQLEANPETNSGLRESLYTNMNRVIKYHKLQEDQKEIKFCGALKLNFGGK